jgi:phosphoserine phosphatase
MESLKTLVIFDFDNTIVDANTDHVILGTYKFIINIFI